MEWDEFPYFNIENIEDIPYYCEEPIEDQLEKKELVKLITDLTLEHGTKSKKEFWLFARFCSFREDHGLIASTTWRQDAARLLGISYATFRQRECDFVRWITPFLEKYGGLSLFSPNNSGRKRAMARV